MSDISKSLAAIADLEKLGLDSIKAVKDVLSAPASLPAYLELSSSVLEALADSKAIIAALPELKGLDGADAEKLGSALYSVVVAIVKAV